MITTTNSLTMGLPSSPGHLANYVPITDLDNSIKVWVTESSSFTMHGKNDKIIQVKRHCLNNSYCFYDYLEEKGKEYIKRQKDQERLQEVNATKTKCKTRHIPILIIE